MTTDILRCSNFGQRRVKGSPLSLVLALGLALAAAGCRAPQRGVLAIDGPVAKSGVAFVADGAGDFQYASKYLRIAAQRDERIALSDSCGDGRAGPDIVTFQWSHGYYHIVSDQVDYAHVRSEGCRLATTVQQFHQDHPGTPVHLVGHSAGAMVVLCALERLPENSVDRVVLLSPSVSASYDLAPALRAVKCGMYSFYNRGDRFYLGLATGILGNSDRHWGPSGGRIGFQVPPATPENCHLLAKFHQRPWQPPDRTLGNFGGHYGNYQPEFARAYVLPLLRLSE